MANAKLAVRMVQLFEAAETNAKQGGTFTFSTFLTEVGTGTPSTSFAENIRPKNIPGATFA